MNFDAETLYNLLPSLYRLRDVEQGEPLKALVEVLAREVAVLEADLEQLYDDQFIETCAEWVVPYIGDLIGDRPLYTNLPNFPSARAAVANTIGYRRRKGTAAMLEQLARDVTGWSARVVEFFELLSTTQYLNHLRPHNLATPNLRDWQSLEYLGSPFETTSHTVDVRRISSKRGRYNIPNIGIFLWRLSPYTMGKFSNPESESDNQDESNTGNKSLDFWGTARKIDEPGEGFYTFNPLGIDIPLFNPPLPEITFTLAEPINVPETLRRRVLYEELEAWRQAIANNNEASFEPLHFEKNTDLSSLTGSRQSVFDLYVILDGEEKIIPSPEIMICNLADWRRPPTNKIYLNELNPPVPVELPIQVAVDPLLGRIAFPDGVIPEQVKVRYTYGFSADVGGGTYDRSESVNPLLERDVTWQLGVSANADQEDPDPELVSSLSEAINQWNSQPNGSLGIIAIADNHTYEEDFPQIEIPEGSQLLLVAASWSEVESPNSSTPQRQIGQISPEFLRPHLLGNIEVIGTGGDGSSNPGELTINGLLIEGQITVKSGNLGQLQLYHSTLVPFPSSLPIPESLLIEPNNELLTLSLVHTITGSVSIANTINQLKIITSLIDGANENALSASATPAGIETSTILGSSSFLSLEASNSIFTQTVTVERRQKGCVRFSSLPLNSQVPRRYRCQPNLALAELAKKQNVQEITDLELRTQIERRLFPQFTSKLYGNPAYGQLSQRCAIEIRQGADDEAEMGVFHDLYQPQRETNLRVRLDEYLRFSLEAGIFYIT